MLVREIMTSPALSVHLKADIDEALRIMAERKVTALPVVEDDDRLVGILSEIDLLRRAVEPDHRAHAIPVREQPPLPKSVMEIMTRNPRTTTRNADVADLVRLFTSSSFKSLPVVEDEDRLIGVISRSDVVRALWREDSELREDLLSAFHAYGQDHWHIDVDRGVVQITGAGSARERDIASAIAHTVMGVRRVYVGTTPAA